MIKSVTQVSPKVGYVLTGAAGAAIGLAVGAGGTYVGLNEELKTQQARHTISLQNKDEVWSQRFNGLQAELRGLKNAPPIVPFSPDEMRVVDYSTQGFVLDSEWVNILVKNEGIHPPKAYEDYALKLKAIIDKLTEIRDKNKPGSLNLPEIVVANSRNYLDIANQNIKTVDLFIAEGKREGENVEHLVQQRKILESQRDRHDLILQIVGQQK